jgi:LmbE family N-acetylglucosaminyl deacetylase
MEPWENHYKNALSSGNGVLGHGDMMAARKSSVVAVGAHPDDIEFGCGGTIAIHADLGDLVTFVYVSNGERGGDPKERVREAREAARILGVKKVEFLGFPDGRIGDSIEVVSKIEDVLRAADADILYTHTLSERHQDHRHVSQAATSAARDCPAVIYFETPSSSNLFRPQYYVNIASTIERKLDAVRMHLSQKSKRGVKPEIVEGQAKFRGFDPGFQFAECFEISHLHGLIQAPRGKSATR